jgi:hypothetical protein
MRFLAWYDLCEFSFGSASPQQCNKIASFGGSPSASGNNIINNFTKENNKPVHCTLFGHARFSAS